MPKYTAKGISTQNSITSETESENKFNFLNDTDDMDIEKKCWEYSKRQKR